MDNRLYDLLVPKLGVNDDELILAKLHFDNGDKVNKGEVIAEFESTKETASFEADEPGYIYYAFEEFTQLSVGSFFGLITEKKLDNDQFLNYMNQVQNDKTSNNENESEIKLTKKARELVEKNNLDINDLPKGILLREKDVLHIIDNLDKKHVNLFNKTYKDNDIMLIGGAGWAWTCIDILNKHTNYEVAGILDNQLSAGQKINGVDVICNDSINNLIELYNRGLRNIAVTFGAVMNHKVRLDKFKKLKEIGFEFPNIIHPSAQVESNVILGEGIIIMPQTSIGPGVVIGDYSLILDGALVSHDCKLGINVYVSPGSVLAGYVDVGSNTLIGMGVTVYFRINIGENVKIYNGLNIFHDIKNDSIVKK